MQGISPTVFSAEVGVVTGGDGVEAGEVTHQAETQITTQGIITDLHRQTLTVDTESHMTQMIETTGHGDV